jgi:hypothetical protein
MSVFCECCMLSGRSLCVGLIPNKTSRSDCGVSECGREASINTRHWPIGLSHHGRKK